MNDCLANIRRAVSGMSANERKLAEFILNNAPLLRDYSSQQLAEAVGVSQSSVVKFSQKLGYRGYPALKLAVSEELARGSAQVDISQIPSPAPHDGSGTIFEELAQTKTDVLKSIAEMNSEKALLEVVRTIEQANRIQFVAAGGYSLVVKDFALKMMIMGKSVVAESDPFVQRANLASMRRGDVLFALSVSGQNGHVNELAEAGSSRRRSSTGGRLSATAQPWAWGFRATSPRRTSACRWGGPEPVPPVQATVSPRATGREPVGGRKSTS